jgi:hypothetical protein
MSTIDALHTDFLAGRDSLDLSGLAAFLDGLSHEERAAAVRSMKGRHQAQLWEASEGRGTSMDDFVSDAAPGEEVINIGKNSLPAFSVFEKRFTRHTDEPDVLYGYNEGSTRPLIGPGFFVAEYFDDRGEVGINYFKVPPSADGLPADWPGIRRNERGLQRFVYAKMIDYMRKVSHHVTIGRAYRKGTKPMNAYFLLCRTRD